MKRLLAVVFIFLGCINGWGQKRILPHVTSSTGGFVTKILLVNSSEAPADYQLIAFNQAGQQSAQVQGTLAGGKTFAGESDDFFQNAEVSFFQIEAADEVSVFAEYKTTSGGSPAQVNASVNQAQRWQFFPGDWSTVLDGFAVVNAGAEATDVVLRQFDGSGVMLTEKVVISDLQPNQKGLSLLDAANFTLGPGHYFQVEGNQALAFMGLRFNQMGFNFLWEMPAIPMAKTPSPRTGKQALTIFFTNDEHGWMEPTATHSGAPGMVGQWKTEEGYTEDGPFVLLSGGDMWTGPAISSWTEGESMTAVMNAMKYDAAALGNHEFDFGLETLDARQNESTFPFLSANIKDKTTGQRPDFAKPFTILNVHGVNVGIIGLTTVSTPAITFESITGPYDFVGYETALRETVPLVKAHGADLVLVTAHTCTMNLLPLAGVFAELDLSLVAGGHCNHQRVDVIEGVPIIEAGSFLRFYGKVQMEYDFDANEVGGLQAELVENRGSVNDTQVQAVVDFWKQATDEVLNEVIGYTATGISRRNPEMSNMITDTWLRTFPDAEVAMVNRGGIRQDIPPGNITRGTIIGVLPFGNFIYQLKLTGAQISANIDCCGPLLGGMRRENGQTLIGDAPLDPNQIYVVLTTDFLYQAGDQFLFGSQDPNPFDTGLNWREPVIDWLLTLETSPDKPLENFLDKNPRKRREE